jgi:hypothetical protein
MFFSRWRSIMGRSGKSVTPFDNTQHTPGDCGIRRVPVLDYETPEVSSGFVREHIETWDDRPPLDKDRRLIRRTTFFLPHHLKAPKRLLLFDNTGFLVVQYNLIFWSLKAKYFAVVRW